MSFSLRSRRASSLRAILKRVGLSGTRPPWRLQCTSPPFSSRSANLAARTSIELGSKKRGSGACADCSSRVRRASNAITRLLPSGKEISMPLRTEVALNEIGSKRFGSSSTDLKGVAPPMARISSWRAVT